MTDLRGYPSSPMMLRPAPARVEELTATLSDIWAKRCLAPGLAGKVFGRLLFNSSQYFGRYGRSMLRAFGRRQHETGRIAWNRQLEAACAFWVPRLRTGRPREIPVDMQSVPLVVSYSDGEGASAGVGVAVWSCDGSAVAGYIRTPWAVRRLWSRQRFAGDEHHDIYEIEAIGPALILHNWPELVRDRLWVHFIDNDNALCALIKGGSSVCSADCIAGWTSGRAAELGAYSWFDRVDTGSNPVDGLSRGKLDGPWRLETITFPPDLLTALRDYLDE